MRAIRTRHLRIRRVAEEDWQSIRDIWAAIAQTPAAQFDTPKDTSDEAVRGRIQKWARYRDSSFHMFFAVCRGDAVIGYFSCNARPHSHELGYSFHPAFHGKGYTRESLWALLPCLRRMGIRRLTAGTAAENCPSVRLLEDLGFRRTGTEQVSFYQDEHGKDIVFEGGFFTLDLPKKLLPWVQFRLKHRPSRKRKAAAGIRPTVRE